MRYQLALAVLTAVAGTLTTSTFAAPYASGVRNLGGSTYEFILNEGADNVVISRDGGNNLTLGSLGAGRHTFDLGGFSTFDIAVSNSAAAGFTAVDDSTNPFVDFDRPGGLAINTIPTSPYFGTIYVNQNRSTNGPDPVSTANGRAMGNGIYSLTADRLGVDLPTFTVPANANDPALAKLPAGITVNTSSSSSLYRIGMDDGGNIIAGDWTDDVGGLKYISADLTTGAVLLREERGPTGGVLSDDSDELGPLALHGSIPGEPQVRGTYGVDLVVAAMDEDLDADLQIDSANDGNSIWEWNIGSTTSNFAGAPRLVAAVGDLHTSSGQDKNSSGVTFPAFSFNPAGTHSDGSPVFLDYNIGVTANAQYNEHFDKWYLSGARTNGDDSSNLVVLTPEGPGGDGRDIEVDWASKQFTIDNGLDGYVDDPDPAFLLDDDPNNDIFRDVHNITFSPDNTVMYVQRREVEDQNPILGEGTGLGAKILAIPLDENGVPDIQISVDDNGTPEDPFDDIITSNITPVFTSASQLSQGSFSQVKTDAAGNLYFTDNISEGLEYFSLGGSTLATTSNNAALSAGDFSLVTLEPLDGDYNGDGTVDAADYTIYRDTLGQSVALGSGADGNGNGVVDAGDYTVWANNYGATSGSPAVAVPEPTTIGLLILSAFTLSTRRRR